MAGLDNQCEVTYTPTSAEINILIIWPVTATSEELSISRLFLATDPSAKYVLLVKRKLVVPYTPLKVVFMKWSIKYNIMPALMLLGIT